MFDTWRAGADRAWFFLDSVDEARLNRKKFDKALRTLLAEVGTDLDRARVLVSCRVSDWKGKSDRQTILDILPIRKPAPPPALASTEMYIRYPLSLRQVEDTGALRLTIKRRSLRAV